ncbi:MAG: hypothetical protein BZ151_03560 [Desulfobacca sp. 4484_104]|nr:MAG: hypothetical protein BZ151_03560 [Desulfobacca sp. 4484_104]
MVLVNARHIQNVPGCKTDVADSQWLAGLWRHGLRRASFIPPLEVRRWRGNSFLKTTWYQPNITA